MVRSGKGVWNGVKNQSIFEFRHTLVIAKLQIWMYFFQIVDSGDIFLYLLKTNSKFNWPNVASRAKIFLIFILSVNGSNKDCQIYQLVKK